jgi:hypothetical protein
MRATKSLQHDLQAAGRNSHFMKTGQAKDSSVLAFLNETFHKIGRAKDSSVLTYFND